jgi:hypothetical protein
MQTQQVQSTSGASSDVKRKTGTLGSQLLDKLAEMGYTSQEKSRLTSVTSQDGISPVSVMHKAHGIGLLIRRYRPEGTSLLKRQREAVKFDPRKGNPNSGEWYYFTDSVSDALDVIRRHQGDLLKRQNLVLQSSSKQEE